ncbi:MAG: hypothetical protein AB4050_07205 [Synechococcus sp.]
MGAFLFLNIPNGFVGNRIVGYINLANKFVGNGIVEKRHLAVDKLKRTVGNYVTGNRFFGREAELELFEESLDSGDHLLLVAQRRMGKTSLMHEVSRRISDRYICLHIDLQDAKDAADAIAELSVATREHKPLWIKTQDLFANTLDGLAQSVGSIQVSELKIKLRGGLSPGDWQSKGNRLLDILASSEQPVAIFCDEVPILVSRMLKGSDYSMTNERKEEAELWMSWLRRNCLQHQGTLRFVVTGSIGLEPLLRKAGLSATINHLTPFDLKAWSVNVACACWDALANEVQLTFEDDVQQRMAALLGVCIPYHVQMFFSHLYQHCRKNSLETISLDLAERIYQQDMLGVRGHADLSHLEERIKMVLSVKQHPLTLELLTEAAVVGQLTPAAAQMICQDYGEVGEDSSLIEILGILKHDGYLIQRDACYEFESNLLRDWWKNHYGFSYVSASDRGDG